MVCVASALAAAVFLGTGASALAGEAKMLVKYEVMDESSIPKSLTGKPGDAKNGRKIAIHRKKGNCLACHKMPISEQPFHGQIGPDLKGVGERYTEGEIRLRVVDPKVVNADSIMPSFYRNDGFHRVLKKFQGKTVLSAQEVEDVVAYLMTLK
jgi:sulfur-oxidizing protein SoxX